MLYQTRKQHIILYFFDSNLTVPLYTRLGKYSFQYSINCLIAAFLWKLWQGKISVFCNSFVQFLKYCTGASGIIIEINFYIYQLFLRTAYRFIFFFRRIFFSRGIYRFGIVFLSGPAKIFVSGNCRNCRKLNFFSRHLPLYAAWNKMFFHFDSRI